MKDKTEKTIQTRYNTLYPDDKIKRIDEEQLLFHLEQMKKKHTNKKRNPAKAGLLL